MKEGHINLKTLFLKINIPHSLTTYIMNYKHTYIHKIWTNDVPSSFDAKQHLTASLLLVYVVQCPQTFFPSSYFECLGRLWWCASVFSCAKIFILKNFTSLVHIKFTSLSHTNTFHLSLPSTLCFQSPVYFKPPLSFSYMCCKCAFDFSAEKFRN